jgi:hypothetical protein
VSLTSIVFPEAIVAGLAAVALFSAVPERLPLSASTRNRRASLNPSCGIG